METFFRTHFRPLDMSTARIINEADIIPIARRDTGLLKGESEKSGMGPRPDHTTRWQPYFSSLIREVDGEHSAMTNSEAIKPDQMWTVAKPHMSAEFRSYGFGWFIEGQGWTQVIGHGGAWQRIPDSHLPLCTRLYRLIRRASTITDTAAWQEM